LAAETILWYAPDLYAFTDPWHSAALTRTVGVGVIAEGALLAFGAALCLGRALRPLTPAPGPLSGAAGGGPALPLCGILILLAATGPCGQARFDSEALEVMDSMPGKWGADLTNDFRRHERTERSFGTLWLVVGGSLLATPLFLTRRVWQLGWRINGVGCAIAVGGFFLSGLGVFVCLVNGMLMEGANKDFSFVGYCGVLAGAAAAVVGSTVAVLRKARP
jgi:hypothetical protein